jgi:hypothetical protein
MGFNEDLQLSEKATEHQDNIYKELFPGCIVRRLRHEDGIILDRKYHIDVEVELVNGIKLLGQEKALRNKWASMDTFTIEFYQNAATKERGEFFNLGAQFYLHGYWNNKEDGLCKWYLIKIFDFLTHLRKEEIGILERMTLTTGGSRASFLKVGYSRIPCEYIYASHRITTQGDSA